ncbi:MAG: DUF4407 domain-containing protein [Chitinophagaceae bacterium]|nr:DUF4407 domain-containing protein [Chitinophagaceae bacterium]
MQEKQHVFSGQEVYAPTRWEQFLWWLATAEANLLKTCVVDRNRYAIIGMSVMGTWVFATLAWTYFFSTVVSNWLLAIPLGIVMGGLILTIDRALIKGINKQQKKQLSPILLRGLLAIAIGTFMAQPALLYLFNKEIHLQISLDNETRKREKMAGIDTAYASTILSITTKKQTLEQTLQTSYAEVSKARESFIAETDGTGGTQKRGYEAVAKAKKVEYDKLDAAYQQLQQQIQPQLMQFSQQLQQIDSSKQAELRQFALLFNDGFLTQIEALNNLIATHPAMRYRYYLLLAILILIELMPVLAKYLLPSGTYEEKVYLREQLEKELTRNNHLREQALKEHYNDRAFQEDKALIDTLFDEANHRKQVVSEKMQQVLETKSFDSFWHETKHQLLSKPEE